LKHNSDLTKELKTIDLDKVFQQSNTIQNKDLLNWVLHTKFYSNSKEKITRTVDKIRDHYHSQKNGGWSSNNYISELINEFATIDTFLNGNYIVYDSFSEYQELTNSFVEGLICSISMNEKQTTKLQYFDDWIIQRIVFHGTPEELRKYVNRYEVQTIKYKKTVSNGSSFFELLNNFFSKCDDLRSEYEKVCEKDNRRFWINYNQYFSNLLVLLAYCDLEKNEIQSISKKILLYLKKEDFINPLNMKYIRLFLNHKGKDINKDVLLGFIQTEYEKEKLHGQDIIKTAIHQIKNHYKKVDLSNEVFTDLLSYTLDDCSSCREKHNSEVILDIHNTVDNSEQKKIIRNRIQENLKDKFDSNFYYLSVMTDVLILDDSLFKSYIDTVKPRKNQKSFESVFSGIKDTRFHQVNNLLDICFKNDIDLSDAVFDDFRVLDIYYEWLFNMEKFDYSKFNPTWTYDYWTIHYINKYKKHPIVLKMITDYLDKNKNSNLQQIAFELTKND